MIAQKVRLFLMRLTKVYLVELPLPTSLYDCKEGKIAKVYLVELPALNHSTIA